MRFGDVTSPKPLPPFRALLKRTGHPFSNRTGSRAPGRAGRPRRRCAFAAVGGRPGPARLDMWLPGAMPRFSSTFARARGTYRKNSRFSRRRVTLVAASRIRSFRITRACTREAALLNRLATARPIDLEPTAASSGVGLHDRTHISSSDARSQRRGLRGSIDVFRRPVRRPTRGLRRMPHGPAGTAYERQTG